MKNSIICEKSYKFAIRIVKLYKYLVEEKHEFTLSKQILKSGTSIGANSEEAAGAQSDKDFLSKHSIAYKEERETHFWLRLLRDTNYIDEKQATSLLTDCEELLKITTSIIRTTKQKLKPTNS